MRNLKIKMNKKNILLILGLAGFVTMADNWVVAPILPSISQNLNIDVPKASIILTAYMIPFGVFQLLYGYLAERFGKRQTILVAMMLFTISTALCAIPTGLNDLTIYRALTGAFAAAIMPISMALIADIFPPKERHAAIGVFMGISFLGQGLSMAIGGSIAYFLNWRGVFAVYAGISIISSFLLLTIGRKIPSNKNRKAKALTPYLKILKKKTSQIIYLLVIFEGVFLVGTFSFLSGFIKQNFNSNNFEIGVIMTSFGIMALVAGRLSGKVSQKIGRKKTAGLGIFLAFIANLITVLFRMNLPFIILGIAIMGFGFMLSHSTFITISTEFSQGQRSFATSLVAFCYMGGGGIGTALGGKILGITDYTNLFSIYGLGLFIIMVIILLLPKNIFQTQNNT